MGESQQVRARQPKQHRVPCCPHALESESDTSRGSRVCVQASNPSDVHDEKGSASVLPAMKRICAGYAQLKLLNPPGLRTITKALWF